MENPPYNMEYNDLPAFGGNPALPLREVRGSKTIAPTGRDKIKEEWMTFRRSALILAGLVSLAGATACDDNTGPTQGEVSLSLTVPRSGGGAAVVSPALFDLVYTDAASTLTLTRVELVMREIELEKVDDESCDSEFEGEDKCEEFETGPRVFELPVDGSTDAVLTISDVPAGLYDELEIEIHKVSSDPEDAALLVARPDLADISIRVEGEFDGTPFIFTTGVEEEFEFALVPPLDPSAGPVNVTLSIDVESWFRSGADLLDPADEQNRSEIENNIQQSFEAFEDDDGDGEDD